MRRATGVAVAGLFVLAVAGCGGGGGGDEEAFCDELDALSELVADGDLGDDDGLEDAVDRANGLAEAAADGEQTDAVQEVGETLAEADPEDAEDTAELIRDELGGFAEDTCDLDGDEFAVAPTTEPPDETTTTTEPPDETTTTAEGGGGDGELNVVEAAVDPASVGVEPGFEENIDLCFRGLMVACDDIFFGENGQAAAPDGSNARAYASSCGGRISFNNETVRCAENLFGAAVPDVAGFTDSSFETLALACQGNESTSGDMAACDQLFAQTGVGTPEELYGDTCGGRIDIDVAERASGTSCVDIFGPVAEFG